MRFRPALAAILMGWITFTACGSDKSSGPALGPRMEPPPLMFASVAAGSDETCGVVTDDDGYCWGGLTASSDESNVGRAPRQEAMFPPGWPADSRFSNAIGGWLGRCWRGRLEARAPRSVSSLDAQQNRKELCGQRL